MERDSPYMTDSGEIGISTHTLTWSVTSLGEDDITATLISTHTLTWSVTRDSIATNNVFIISTHTLTWSVTNGD